MENEFLKLIDDTKDRVFPLIYKYVKISEMPESVKKRKYIKVDLYNTDMYEPESYHKPISKLF